MPARRNAPKNCSALFFVKPIVKTSIYSLGLRCGRAARHHIDRSAQQVRQVATTIPTCGWFQSALLEVDRAAHVLDHEAHDLGLVALYDAAPDAPPALTTRQPPLPEANGAV